MILQRGEKIHVIHRRHFEQEAHRHFVGIVEEYDNGVARVVGHVFTVDKTRFAFVRRADARTRIISLASGELVVNVLPSTVDLDKVVYKQEQNILRVTDGSDWHMDISEVAWK
jgi:hypothetical protein